MITLLNNIPLLGEVMLVCAFFYYVARSWF